MYSGRIGRVPAKSNEYVRHKVVLRIYWASVESYQHNSGCLFIRIENKMQAENLASQNILPHSFSLSLPPPPSSSSIEAALETFMPRIKPCPTEMYSTSIAVPCYCPRQCDEYRPVLVSDRHRHHMNRKMPAMLCACLRSISYGAISHRPAQPKHAHTHSTRSLSDTKWRNP